jgi:hypothetical protein
MADLTQTNMPVVPSVDTPTVIPPTSTMPGVAVPSPTGQVAAPVIQAEPSPLLTTSASNVPLTINVPVKAVENPVTKQDTNNLIAQNQQILNASAIKPVVSFEDAVHELNNARAALNNYDSSVEAGQNLILNRIQPITETQGQLEAQGRQTSATRNALARSVDAYTGYVQAAQAQRDYELRVKQMEREYQLEQQRLALQQRQIAAAERNAAAEANPYNQRLSKDELIAFGNLPAGTTWGDVIEGGISPNKPLSEEAKKNQANVESGLKALQTVRSELFDAKGNIRTSILLRSKVGMARQYTSALNEMKDVIARLRTGAALTENEEKFYTSQLPGLRDNKDTIKSKLQRFEQLFQGIQSRTSIGLPGIEQQVIGSGRPRPGDLNFVGPTSGNLGSLSEKYESGGNPGAIGKDSTGGWSYGVYQLAHNNVDRFLSSNPNFGTMFKGLKKGTTAFNNKWKQVAQKYPSQFAQAQKNFIAQTHFQPQVSKLQKLGINVNNFSSALKDVIWSTAVQHGANTNVVANAIKKVGKNASETALIKAIYNERWNGGKGFASSTPAVKQSVYNRFFGKNGEMNRALAMVSGSSINRYLA